jgi:ribosomal protein S27E
MGLRRKWHTIGFMANNFGVYCKLCGKANLLGIYKPVIDNNTKQISFINCPRPGTVKCGDCHREAVYDFSDLRDFGRAD